MNAVALQLSVGPGKLQTQVSQEVADYLVIAAVLGGLGVLIAWAGYPLAGLLVGGLVFAGGVLVAASE